MKIRMTIPAVSILDAIAMRDRIKGVILQGDETAVIADGGVLITTGDPARVSLELMAEGIID